MKILHIITDVNTGGALSLLRKITSENSNSKIKHTIISIKAPNNDFKISNIEKVYSLNVKRNVFIFLKLFKLIKIIKSENPNVIQTWMYHSDLIGGIAAKILGIKKIYWSILSYSISKEHVKFSTRIIVYINAFLSFYIPEKIIFCASSAQSIHEKIGYCRKKFIHIPIWFNVKNDFFIRDNLNKIISFHIGCIARWDPDKDHRNLFNALRILDKKNINYRCDLIGPMMIDNNKELQLLIKQTNVDKSKLKLMGFVKNLNQVYLNFDICILSSRTEAFPIVIGESMIMGTPVIATDTGDVKKIINQFGWVVPLKNPEKLSESILDAISKSSDKSAWNRIRLGAHKHIINNYSTNDMLNRYNRLWKTNN